MAEEFKLYTPEVIPHGGRGGRRPGAGRRPGSRSKLHTVLGRTAQLATGEIQRQHIVEAQRYGEYMRAGDMRRARFAFESGQLIMARTWPEPRSSPVQIAIDSRQGVMAAMEAGELTPADAATLLRSEHL